MRSATLKNIILTALCCTALMAGGATLNLSSASLNLTGTSTASSTPGTALFVDANVAGNVLVIGTFSTKASIQKTSAEGIWQLKSTSQTSTPIKRSLDNKKDLGIASVVHIFTGIAANETIALQHSSSDTSVTVTTLGANLVAIPLKVSSNETLDYGLHQQSGTSSITDIGFVTTGIKTSVDLPRTTDNRLYMAASFNSQTTTAPATGTWKLQYRKSTDTPWTDTGSEIRRSMSTASDQGAVTLYGLVEGLPLGTYEVQLVCKSAAGKTIQTLNGTLAAVALSYGTDTSVAGGHFDGFSVTATSLSEVGDTPYTGAQASMTLASAGSGIFASMNFTAVPTTGANQTGAFDLSTTIGFVLSTSGNQENQRYFANTSDYGSGGSAGYFANLGAGTHSIYGRYENVTGPVNAPNVTLVGFATESITDAGADADNDIGITKAVNDSTPAEGQRVQFTLVATSLGTNVATNVTVFDKLPNGLTYVSDSGGGSYNTVSGVWTVGELSPGESATLTIGATVDASTAGSSITNKATISTDSDDDNAANDEAEAVVTIQTSQPSADCGLTYLVADNGSPVTSGGDLFTKVDRATGSNTVIGDGTGTSYIEAIAFSPSEAILYAANAGDLGFINITTGVYTFIGSFGTGGNGSLEILFDDVDGLSFDPLTGILYGSVRRSSSEDLLIQIDPATGAHIPDAFGGGVDYVVINAVSNLYDIDDIAIDSYDGQMYAIANQAGKTDRLVKIDKLTGVATDVGPLNVNDHEGLSFSNDGQLFGTTGQVGDDSLYDVNKTTGVASNPRVLDVGSDYEASESLTCPPSRIEGTVFLDANADAFLDGGDSGTSNMTVRLYRDVNGDGLVDGNDVLLATQKTDANGKYAFDVASTGAFVLDVDITTLPAGSIMTTDNIEAADFGDAVGMVESGNDFGFYTARLYGYAFWDKNDNLMRDDGVDGANSNMVVQLWFDGQQIATTLAATNGYYNFPDLVPGDYEVRFICNTNYLVAIPTSEDAAFGEPERNRASPESGYATVTYALPAGHGVDAAGEPDDDLAYGEPVNAGFLGGSPTSSGIDLRAYKGADGVVVEFVACDVEENGTIDLKLLDAGGAEVWSGSVDVTAGPRFFARFLVPGLESGQSYDFRVRDEVGKSWEARGVTVGSFEAEMTRASLTGVTLSFDSLPEREYEIQWTEQLGSLWRTVTNVPSQGEQTRVGVIYPEPEASAGFFKIILK